MTEADREAITDLLLDYAYLVDAGDLVGVAALFARGSYRTAGTGHRLDGADAVLAAQRHIVRLYDGVPRTHHNITNISVTVADDRSSATSRSYYTVIFAPPGEEPRVILTGRYEDTFARDEGDGDGGGEEGGEGAWHFTDRLIHMDQVGDLSGHLHLDRLDGP